MKLIMKTRENGSLTKCILLIAIMIIIAIAFYFVSTLITDYRNSAGQPFKIHINV